MNRSTLVIVLFGFFAGLASACPLEGDVPVLTLRPDMVAGVRQAVLSLNGRWRFTPAAPGDMPGPAAGALTSWAEIDVPAEWAMQGFSVAPGADAAYAREVIIPSDWANCVKKLRFDAVQSECTVWVNGVEVGHHEGGFAVFEFDVTGVLRTGRNLIVVRVRNETLADTLASSTQYAAHALGGITRKVTLVALPPLHLSTLATTTTFLPGYADADLEITLAVSNRTASDVHGADLSFDLVDRAGVSVPLDVTGARFDTIRQGETATRRVACRVRGVEKWDPEHPYLHTLRVSLLHEGHRVQAGSHRIGFRQVEVRGNRLFVNGLPVKLRGVNRHETHPLLGRSTAASQWRRDVELFRAANVNYIRTSHYPPTEEFLDACDELGVFVECEAALCWVQHGANPAWEHWNAADAKYFSFLLRANLENIAANRGHPSIIIWSLANESGWSPLFARVLEQVKMFDPTRPTSFHDQCWGEYNNAGSRADVAVYHYPDEAGPAKCDSSARPVLFGEFAHIETYNRREVVTDPGVRDDWGRGFERMVDVMWNHDGCLGGAIWAGVDDIFALPDGRAAGYGPWGIIDGWRRPKPEYWHVKKSYSPVKLADRNFCPRVESGRIRIPVRNRFDFSNLNEVSIRWTIGADSGLATAEALPHSSGEIIIPFSRVPTRGERLELRYTDPRGFECDREVLRFSPRPAAVPAARGARRVRSRVVAAAGSLSLVAGRLRCDVDRSTGLIRSLVIGKQQYLSGGPALMVLPLMSDECKPDYRADFGTLNQTCAEPKAGPVKSVRARDGSEMIEIPVAYREAEGRFLLSSVDGRSIAIEYLFTVKQEINPRQWGAVVSAPIRFDRLAWTRRGQWTSYPEDHIGREEGEAAARVSARPTGLELRKPPVTDWRSDSNELGSNDFRSTKTNVDRAVLKSRRGEEIGFFPDTTHAVRAFVEEGAVHLLAAAFATGGGEGFFSPHFAAERRPLKPGDVIRDRVVLRFTPAPGEE
jgi:beta-galactosidase